MRPISAVATSILPHLGKQLFSAVAPSNLPRNMSYTKTKQCPSRLLACDACIMSSNDPITSAAGAVAGLVLG